MSKRVYRIECPWCKGLVEIEQINCGIFRHGYDRFFRPIAPHASQRVCQQQTKYGCGKPFKFNGKHVDKCGYI